MRHHWSFYWPCRHVVFKIEQLCTYNNGQTAQLANSIKTKMCPPNLFIHWVHIFGHSGTVVNVRVMKSIQSVIIIIIIKIRISKAGEQDRGVEINIDGYIIHKPKKQTNGNLCDIRKFI